MQENSERRRIVVNLDQPQVTAPAAVPRGAVGGSVPTFGQPVVETKKKPGLFKKILLTLTVLLLLAIVGGAIGGYLWWESYRKSPSYSLALLVDAARRDDKTQTEELLDTNLVVENFVPQVIESAKNRYGRGVPPQVLERATTMLAPVLPAVKERARVEIPRLVRDRLQSVPQVSPWLMGIGISRAATVTQTGETAIIKGKIQEREVELAMQRTGDRWKVVGLTDAVLADKIADTIGQKVLQLASQRPNAANQNKAAADLAEQIKRQIQQLTP